MENQGFQDYIIKCGNPTAFDQTINSMGAMLRQESDGTYSKNKDGNYYMRVLGNPGYVEFAIKNQGYGEIIEKTGTSD